jgi:hypothetical protein
LQIKTKCIARYQLAELAPSHPSGIVIEGIVRSVNVIIVIFFFFELLYFIDIKELF